MTRRLATIVSTFLLLAMLLAPLPAMAKGVVLNFSDVDIVTMAKFISDLTGKNFVMDDRVKGKISVFSPGKLTPDEAFNLFTSVLELKGFTLTQAGKVYKIIPTPSAKQSGMKILTDDQRGPVNESYVAQVISLEHISAQDAVSFLQPVVSRDGYISAFGPANMVLVVDSSLNIRKVLDIINLIDSDHPREKAEVIYLKNSVADTLTKVIQEWLKSRDKSVKPGQPQASSGGLVVADPRLNAIVVFGTDKDKEDVRNLVALLDVVPPTSTSKINVYYLENADATDVAKVMDTMLKGAPVPGQPVVANAANQSPFEGGKISITPDKATNSLVVMASPADYQSIVSVIQKLDKRRRQVFVQALIAEISLDKVKDLGLEWGVLGAASDGKNASVVGSYDPQNTITQLLALLGTAGLGDLITLPKTGTPMNFAAVLHALQSHGAVNVLSTPTILTSDNKEAEIFVGQNVPFISANVSTSVSTTQSVERKDVGIDLKITPQISEGEYVKLDIYQEISAVVPTLKTSVTVTASDLITTKRSAKTSIVVKDKDTVAIGGLIQDQDTDTESKIPFLGDIPGLGWLFKTNNHQRTKTNLLIVLTPRIIRGAQELAEVTGAQRDKFGEAVRMDQPFSLNKELQLKP